jgi:hypothetical protein
MLWRWCFTACYLTFLWVLTWGDEWRGCQFLQFVSVMLTVPAAIKEHDEARRKP